MSLRVNLCPYITNFSLGEYDHSTYVLESKPLHKTTANQYKLDHCNLSAASSVNQVPPTDGSLACKLA
jgi:hypothetical protein